MADKDLLLAAAKAAGYLQVYGKDVVLIDGHEHFLTMNRKPRLVWNPLEDDGDALRLAVQLRISINFTLSHANCEVYDWRNEEFLVDDIGEDGRADFQAATRRAIVRAAASLAGTVKQ